MNAINVTNEIGKLKKIFLHRPGKELLNITPDSKDRLLIDDIPYLENAQKEHDEFVKLLEDNGVEVVYLVNLMAETLNQSVEIKEFFIKQWIYEAGIRNPRFQDRVFDYLNNIEDTKELVTKTIEGIKIGELDFEKEEIENSLADMVSKPDKLIAEPIPNIAFTRDPFASIGQGISLSKSWSETRRRETIYAEYIFKHHPEYKEVKRYYGRYSDYSIEGGDILVLSENILAIGISQRTTPEAIDSLAQNLFDDPDSKVDTILAFAIPEIRAFMHLDTVFTQIDYDKFTYFPGIMETLQVFEITKDKGDTLRVIEKKDSLENILGEYLKKKITLIPCAGGDLISSEREQWNDGSNTLAIAPGVVIVYDRNNITNKVLRDNGIKVLEMCSGELSRMRGGPRCLSMPLVRDDLEK